MVLEDGSIVELPNLSPTPNLTFAVEEEAVTSLVTAVAMWHTHPKNNVNLSVNDYKVFVSLPKLTHYIVTESRVRSFIVQNGRAYLHDTYSF